MNGFICPVCGGILEKNENCYLCNKGHSFDISKRGYVNLLLSQHSKTKQHGDDKAMVKSRRDFLEKGFYTPLLTEILRLVSKYSHRNVVILDAGCGECWYTSRIFQRLVKAKKSPTIFAIDISKNALDLAGKRGEQIFRAVASVFKVPLPKETCDLLLNIFSPYCSDEYLRVLKNGGILLRVIPLERHLFSLKSLVYDKPYENTVEDYALKGYEFLEEKRVLDTINLTTNQEVLDLFMMTPYYYKTSREDFAKLENVASLETETQFAVLIYKKL